MTKRILLHVGTPKTGTSHLQDVLFRNRTRLAEQGIDYPADRFDAHFLAALDLMALPWGGLETEAIGAWDALAGQVRAARGTVVVSHEILAHASRTQVDRALGSLAGPTSPAEIHLVLSVRDLARQIPAEWQENVKHRSTVSYARFLRQIRDPERSSRIGSWFWAVQEIPDILDRWGRGLPPERIHLITVPPAGGAPELLWKRFSQVFGLDGLDLDLEAERANPSLGVPETALVRRINRSVNRVLHPHDYRPLVRELLAHQTLSRREGSPRLSLPPDTQAWAGEVARGLGREVDRRGYDVVGDVDELLVGPPRSRRTSTRTRRASGRSPQPPSTRSRRWSWTTPGCAPKRHACTESWPRPGPRSSGRSDGPATACATSPYGDWRRDGWVVGCSGSTAGCGAGAPGRRSDRSATSRTRRRRRRPARRRPGPAVRSWWPAACRRPW